METLFNSTAKGAFARFCVSPIMKKFPHVTWLIALSFYTSLIIEAQINTIPLIAAKSLENKSGPIEDRPAFSSLRGNGMNFTENKGQIIDMAGNLRRDILYMGDGNGAGIYLRETGISHVFTNMVEVMHEVHEKVEAMEQSTVGLGNKTESEWEQELMRKEKIKTHRVDMDFAGCNSNIKVISEDEVEGYNNYYYPHCPNGILNVKQYNKVTYKNIYDGIDVVCYGGKATGLKYDLIVHPGANPAQIKLHWKGAESIHIYCEGNGSTGSVLTGTKGLTTSLVIKTSLNEFTELIPKIYQNINGKIVDVKAQYKLSASGIVSFSFGEGWDEAYPLVIDPWATYYGGIGDDQGYSVACDNAGNVYLAGKTLTYPNTGNVIATPGSHQTVYGGGTSDAFLVKFNSATGTRIWSTYYGGTNNESGYGVACDNSGNVYMAGYTNSLNAGVIATAGAHQAVFGGWNEAYLVKFNSAGARIWATYYGAASATEEGYSVACDITGNVYLAGMTGSPNAGVITTAGAHQTFFGGGADAFLVKFDPSGARIWATYYGGTLNEVGHSVACDNTGNVYLAGWTASPNAANVIATATGHQTVFGGGFNDAFLVKFNSAGVRIWATYYGGTGREFGYSAACDNIGNVYLAGNTSSPNAGNVIATATGYQTFFGGGSVDAFLVQFNSASGLRTWGTYYGSNSAMGEMIRSGCLAIDSNNNAYLYLELEDDLGPPLDPCAYQPNHAGGVEDQIIVKFNSAGKKLCATYFGGTGYEDLDNGGGIAASGNLLFICAINGTGGMPGGIAGGYPVTAGVHQTVHGGSYDAVLACLCINICEGKTSLGLNFTAATNVCANTPVTFTPTIANSCDTTGYKYHWVFTGGSPATSNLLNPAVSFSGVGTHTVKLVVTTLCKKDSITIANYITINNCGCSLSATTNTTTNVTCNGTSNGSASVIVTNGSGGPYTYNWSNGINGSTTSTAISISGLSAASYTVTITEGSCTSASNFIIIAPPPLTGQFTKGTASCTGCGCKQWIMVNATGGTSPYTYSWPDGYLNRYKNQLCPGSYSINIKDKNGCSINVNLTAP